MSVPRMIAVVFEIDDAVTVEQAEAALEEMVTLAPESCRAVVYVGTRRPGESW